MSDEAVALSRAGIPVAALSTTLPLEGHPELRQLITEGSCEYTYEKDEEERLGLRGIIMHRGGSDYRHVRRVADVFAKELVLYGYNKVRTTTLSRMLDNVEHEQDWYLEHFRGHTVVKDFYVEGIESPYTGRTLNRMQSLLVDLMDDGNAFTLVAATENPPELWGWYGSDFLKTLSTDLYVAGI